jgi:hypothetical protein
MDIYRMQNEANDRGMHNEEAMKFRIVGPLKTLEAKWADPFFGFIEIPSTGAGVFMVKQFDAAFPPLDFIWGWDEPETETD